MGLFYDIQNRLRDVVGVSETPVGSAVIRIGRKYLPFFGTAILRGV